jgi:hypothetical protein
VRPELPAKNLLPITNNQPVIVVNFLQDFVANTHCNFLRTQMEKA